MELLQQIKKCDVQKPFIFVSYSKADKEHVYPIVLALQQRGYNVWIDKQLKDLAGEDWQNGALGAIASPYCKALLLFISENSMTSIPVFSELMYSKSIKAKMNNRDQPLKIIPVNVSEHWDPTKGQGLEEWLKLTVAQDPNIVGQPLGSGAADMMRKAKANKYVKLLSHRGEIPFAIYTEMFKPNGGSKMTLIPEGDIETIIGNIDESVIDQRISASDAPIVSTVAAQEPVPEPVPESIPEPVPTPVPAAPSEAVASPGAAITSQTTIGEFRDYMADEGNNSQLLALWNSMKKGPGYVVLAAILGGPGMGDGARKNFVINIAKTTSNGTPNAGTWSSMVAGYMNDSRSLGPVAAAYKSLPASMTLGELEGKFRATDEPGFHPLRGSTEELLENFALLYHTGEAPI